jgi:lysyl-tRNA synthetase class I
MGQETGPRMGSFVALYGAKNFADLIQKILNVNE